MEGKSGILRGLNRYEVHHGCTDFSALVAKATLSDRQGHRPLPLPDKAIDLPTRRPPAAVDGVRDRLVSVTDEVERLVPPEIS